MKKQEKKKHHPSDHVHATSRDVAVMDDLPEATPLPTFGSAEEAGVGAWQHRGQLGDSRVETAP